MCLEDHVRRLPLPDERGDQGIQPFHVRLGYVDAGSGFREYSVVMAVCSDGLVKIPFLPALCFFMASIADKRGPLDRPAALFHEMVTVPVAGMAGTALFSAGDSSVADIPQTAGCAESTLVRGSEIIVFLKDAVLLNLFGNGGWIFAEILCDLAKRHVLIERSLDKYSVLSGQMFLVSGD